MGRSQASAKRGSSLATKGADLSMPQCSRGHFSKQHNQQIYKIAGALSSVRQEAERDPPVSFHCFSSTFILWNVRRNFPLK